MELKECTYCMLLYLLIIQPMRFVHVVTAFVRLPPIIGGGSLGWSSTALNIMINLEMHSRAVIS